jgi:hypothetical protein
MPKDLDSDNPQTESELLSLRLKARKETEFMGFLRAECSRLRMNVPTSTAVRDTIDFLAENNPGWDTETSSEEFARILIKRYPELRFEWSAVDESEGSEALGDEPATEKQIAYLKVLGAPIPPYLGLRAAADLIDEWKNRASDAQKRRLNFYKLAYNPNISREEANALIDSYKAEHPQSEEAYQEWKINNGIT